MWALWYPMKHSILICEGTWSWSALNYSQWMATHMKAITKAPYWTQHSVGTKAISFGLTISHGPFMPHNHFHSCMPSLLAHHPCHCIITLPTHILSSRILAQCWMQRMLSVLVGYVPSDVEFAEILTIMQACLTSWLTILDCCSPWSFI